MFDADQDMATVEHHDVLGQAFNGPMTHGLPVHPDLHARVWQATRRACSRSLTRPSAADRLPTEDHEARRGHLLAGLRCAWVRQEDGGSGVSVPGAAPPPNVESTAARIWVIVRPFASISLAMFAVLTQMSQKDACSS